MRAKTPPLLAGAALVAGIPLFFAALPIRAQDTPRSASRAQPRSMSEVLSGISRSAGVVVLADSTIRGRVSPPAGETTAENVEQQLAQVKRQLSPTAIWVKLYLPAPASGRWNGDAVAEYGRALARLLGRRIGSLTPKGAVEIMGQLVPADKAPQYIDALHLSLVYLLTDPSARSARGGESSLTPEQQRLVEQFSAMSPSARMQMALDLHHQMKENNTPQLQEMQKLLWGAMSDEERLQTKKTIADEENPGDGGGKP